LKKKNIKLKKCFIFITFSGLNHTAAILAGEFKIKGWPIPFKVCPTITQLKLELTAILTQAPAIVKAEPKKIYLI